MIFRKIFETIKFNMFNKINISITNNFYKYDIDDAIKTIKSTLPQALAATNINLIVPEDNTDKTEPVPNYETTDVHSN